MKKLDKLLIKSFLPPFILASFIALFVLIMQGLWQFVDEIVGKGVSTFTMIEMIAYMSISLVPMALPIGVLISSVMVFGNLSERYELSSMKSAGVSLMRVMIPVFWIALLISLGSFMCSNYLMPVSNLKFKTRLLDIKKQKPALSLEEGVFNDDFSGYSIRIGDKEEDGRNIRDVMIYDHVNAPLGRISLIRAEKGEMFMTDDQNFLVMRLYDGEQYQEMQDQKDRFRPFLRSRFKEWEKVFDLGEFELERTDEDLYKSHYQMLSVRQLADKIDTLNWEMNQLKENQIRDLKQSEESREYEIKSLDGSASDQRGKIRDLGITKAKIPPQRDSALQDLSSLAESFVGKDSMVIASRALNQMQNRRNAVLRNFNQYKRTDILKAKHKYELHTKFALATICIIFLFVGGPMGAIIRKGGYGYPLLVTIIFFIIYIVMTMAFKEMVKVGTMHPTLAAWLPNLVFLPICFVLTYQAMNDTKFMDLGRRMEKIRRFFSHMRPPPHA